MLKLNAETLYMRDKRGNIMMLDEKTPATSMGLDWVFEDEGIASRIYAGLLVEVCPRFLVSIKWAVDTRFIAAVHHWHQTTQNQALIAPGEYYLVGPECMCNWEDRRVNQLIPVGQHMLPDAPRDYAGLKQYLTDHPMYGILWEHEDGRRAEIYSADLGIAWPRTNQ